MSRPDLSHCVELVSTRMRVFRFFPRSKASRAAMAALIQEATTSNHHADLLVRSLLTSFDDWPGPVTVRKVAAHCRPAKEQVVNSEVDACGFCGGSGLTLDAQPCPLGEVSVGEVRRLLLDGAKLCGRCHPGRQWAQIFEGEFKCE